MFLLKKGSSITTSKHDLIRLNIKRTEKPEPRDRLTDIEHGSTIDIFPKFRMIMMLTVPGWDFNTRFDTLITFKRWLSPSYVSISCPFDFFLRSTIIILSFKRKLYWYVTYFDFKRKFFLRCEVSGLGRTKWAQVFYYLWSNSANMIFHLLY